MSLGQHAQVQQSRLHWWQLTQRRIARQQLALNTRLGLDETGEPLVLPTDDTPAAGLFPTYEDELKRQGAVFFRTLHLHTERRWG